jgi:hypothetical protein
MDRQPANDWNRLDAGQGEPDERTAEILASSKHKLLKSEKLLRDTAARIQRLN